MYSRDLSSDVCSSDLFDPKAPQRCSFLCVPRSVCHSRVEAKGDWACAEKGQCLVSRPDGGHPIKQTNKQRPENSRHTVSVFVWMLGKEWVRSHQGDMSTPPAGAGRPESRMTWRSASDKPPPAESPAITIRSGLMGRCAAPSGGLIKKISRLVFNFMSDNAKNHSHAARRSWMAQGKGY